MRQLHKISAFDGQGVLQPQEGGNLEFMTLFGIASWVSGHAVSGRPFLRTPPHCLKKNGTLGRVALVADREHPVLLHRPRTRAALAADDHPVDAFQVELAEVFQQRLDREEPHGGRGSLRRWSIRGRPCFGPRR